MSRKRDGRDTRTKDEHLHPLVWLLLVVWTTLRGAVGIAIAVAVFSALVALTVMAILDSGPEEVLVPNVVGMPLAKAKDVAAESGLELIVAREVYSKEIGHGMIADTRPRSGNTTKLGRRVEAVLSLGAKEVKVPKVVGHSLGSAEKLISDAGLKAGKVSRRSHEAAADQVITQSPAAGEIVGRENPVNLEVSGGADFGSIAIEGGQKLLFRTVVIRLPAGDSLQRLIVRVSSADGEYHRTFYNRVRRPGDEVRVDIYAATGHKLEVQLAQETVLEQTF